MQCDYHFLIELQLVLYGYFVHEGFTLSGLWNEKRSQVSSLLMARGLTALPTIIAVHNRTGNCVTRNKTMCSTE